MVIHCLYFVFLPRLSSSTILTLEAQIKWIDIYLRTVAPRDRSGRNFAIYSTGVHQGSPLGPGTGQLPLRVSESSVSLDSTATGPVIIFISTHKQPILCAFAIFCFYPVHLVTQNVIFFVNTDPVQAGRRGQGNKASPFHLEIMYSTHNVL